MSRVGTNWLPAGVGAGAGLLLGAAVGVVFVNDLLWPAGIGLVVGAMADLVRATGRTPPG